MYLQSILKDMFDKFKAILTVFLTKNIKKSSKFYIHIYIIKIMYIYTLMHTLLNNHVHFFYRAASKAEKYCNVFFNEN